MVFVAGGHVFFFFKQKTAYEVRISDWSSDVCSSDLWPALRRPPGGQRGPFRVTGFFRPTRFLLSLHQTWIFLTAAGPIAGDGLCARFPARGGFGVSLHPMAIPSNYGPAILIPDRKSHV